MLSKIISKSKMQSIVGEYQFSNQEMQKEISSVIEKDATLDGKLTQLSNSECDCENENSTDWNFPIICTINLFICLGSSFAEAYLVIYLHTTFLTSFLQILQIISMMILFLFDCLPISGRWQ